MDYHYHARLVVHSREQLAKSVLEGGLSLKEPAASFKLSRQSAAKWVRRYRDQGVAGLNDRSSRPHRSPRGTSQERIMEIEHLRRQRWTGVRIAHRLGLSQATGSRVLRRLKLNRIRHIEPQLPPNRYEHAAPGDLLHLDIKRLVRIKRPSHRVSATDAGCTRIRKIPGIGPIVATAIVAAIGNGAAFRKGRDFAAWLGLVPRQYSTGGKAKLLGISKRGNIYLRKVLIHGARAAAMRIKRDRVPIGAWLDAHDYRPVAA